MKLVKGIALLSSAAVLTGCFLDDSDDDSSGVSYPSTYAFTSKFDDSASSVKFSGQAARQILIAEMKKFTGDAALDEAGLTAIYASGSSVLDDSNLYGADDGTGTPLAISAPDGFTLVQKNYTDVFAEAGSKKLSNKTAGCDNSLSTTQFIGWDVTTLVDCGTDNNDDALDDNDAPYSLLKEWITAAAVNPVDTTLGLNYQQLFQKFLLGAVAFSQTSQDYLKSSKGLTKDNSIADDGADYTSLEHQWDEGFGYFGASVDYLNIADATINGKTNHSDVNADGEIDLLKGEYNFGLAQYASKHDVLTGTTDLSNDIMVAFLEGRQLIQDNFGTNPVEGQGYHAELTAISDRAVKGLDKIFAISVIKYINETIDDLGSYVVGAGNNDVSNLAKHWSELKGFALGLQFNLNPVMTEAQQIDLHAKIGQSPINKLETEHGDKDLYIAELEAARTLVQAAYGFDAEAVKTWK
jgi:hypothetical protein